MSGKKRSIITPERLAHLKQTNAAYVISCYNEEYFCDNHTEGCSRGFFSLYIQAIYGISFARQRGMKYYVDFGNVIYFYSDEKKFNGDLNFWNYYFNQKELSSKAVKVLNERYENYPLRVWSRTYIKKLHEEAVSQLVFKNDISQSISQIQSHFSSVKVLGVHLRRTDHFLEIKQSRLSSYFKAVDRRIKEFEKVFVATDDEAVLNEFLHRYPGKVIYNSVYRSSGTIAIHSDKTIADRYQLGKDALLDCYSLSFCDRTILSPSNFSYAALLINPNQDYEIIESWQARWIRWKTLFVFYLDKWKIRKW